MVNASDLDRASLLATELRGSAGGWVASRNASGPYFRPRNPPTNLATAARQAQRKSYGLVVRRWWRILSQPQRDAWNQHAAGLESIDRLGYPILLTGQQAYVRANGLYYRGVANYIDAPPPDTRAPQWTTPTHTVFPFGFGTRTVVTIDTTDPWYSNAGSILLGFWSPRLRPTIFFHKTPLVLGSVFKALGAGTQTTFELFLPAQSPIHRVIRWRAVDAQGRVGNERWAYNYLRP